MSPADRRIAFVTGASRGIGKASALALAEAGYDVAITARTVSEGQRFEHSSTVKRSDTRPLPGSLETTAEAVRARGREVLPLEVDLLKRESIEAAVARCRDEWGPVDLLLNNAIYTGPGTMDRFLDIPQETLETIFEANVFAQLYITRLTLSAMLARGSGVIINMTSGAGLSDPPAPAGEGGWGVAYGASKGAFHRLTGVLAVEHAGSGLRFHNIEPGFVVTEAMKASGLAQHFDEAGQGAGAPPEVPAAVVRWLATEAAAAEWNGKTVYAQKFCKEKGLLPGWPPAPRDSGDD